ncbi:MAG: M48 family metalloprotease [Deltaproteobacteria bacterium]
MIKDLLFFRPSSLVRRPSGTYFLWIAACLAFLAGCATVYNPATGRQEHIFIDDAQEVQIGRSMAENIVTKEDRLLPDAAVQRRVNIIGQRIARASDRTGLVYHFGVLENEDLNAFALPGGYVYMYSGLYDRIDEGETAAILAHEVAHVAAKHSVKKMQSALGYNMLLAVALAGLGGRDPAVAQNIAAATNVVYDLLSKGYGRQDELLADKLAVRYMAAAGYDPHGLVRVLELLNTQKGPGGRIFEVLSTHPRMEERIRLAEEEIARLKGMAP